MAISAPSSLAGSSNGVDATSFTTASFTPTANRLVVAIIVNTRSAATVPNPALSGNGISWTLAATQGFTTTGSPQRRVTAFLGVASSPTTGVHTIDFAGDTQTECFWSIFEIAGAATTAAAALAQTPVTSGGGNATSDSLSLATIRRKDSIVLGAWTHNANETSTVGTGFTAIHNLNANSPAHSLLTEYILVPQTTVDASWTTNSNRAGIAMEIRVPIDTTWVGVTL